MTKRVLIASSQDWAGTARLPSMLGAAGLSVHLLDAGRTQAASSSWLESRVAVSGGPGPLAERLLQEAPSFDRVIVCDESLLQAVCDAEQPIAPGVLPAEPETLLKIMDKTVFPTLARQAGLRVSPSSVVATEDGLEAELQRLGTAIILKGRTGVGGSVVREVSDIETARGAAEDLGYPILVEEWVDGRLCLLPCLFERGRLVAAVAAEKVMTMRKFAPSAVNLTMPVDDGLLRIAVTAGEAFGLHGFASIDMIFPTDGTPPIVLEINPRPVPQLHLGWATGVDMAQALRDVIEGSFDGDPLLSDRSTTVALFPQELIRNRLEHGIIGGYVRWASTPGAFKDMPWDDRPLLRRQLVRGY